ncbi:hypothetical protein [Paenibacillus sp. GYB003]|uniref:hypothetical protein n=1 Tax=Paenibacillus sp. GYB003 TaxID=2994392 RepID=UPI002F96123C
MDYKEIEFSKRTARALSMIFPGMGLMFYSKWKAGGLFIILHVLFGFLSIRELIERIAYYTYHPSGDREGMYEFFFIWIALLAINWAMSLICTEKVNPND